MKILMVCLGNICRSPMAEGVLRHLANEKGLEIEIDSCGTSNYHSGEAPDKRAIKTMKSKGISIESLKARQFKKEDFRHFDRIFTMDESNYVGIKALAENQDEQDKIDLYLNQAFPSKNLSVPDPYFGGDDGFEEVYQLLHEASSKFLMSLQEK